MSNTLTVSISGAARQAHVSRRSVFKWIKRGWVTAIHLNNRRTLVTSDSLERLIRRRRAA